MVSKITVRAPSSTANLGPGFDTFGLAIDAFYDEITLSKTKGEISIKEKERIKKRELLNKSKDSDLYKNVLEKFSDASLIDVSLKKTKKE